jgi:2-dehydro-3-deoxyphosphogluconate aldolase/(4S)-4-hydroxy-2-oxoglutarate aldolase
MSDQVVRQITARRVLPVVVVDDPARAPGLADALVAGGLPIAEITLRTPAALAAIQAVADREDLIVGAGSVIRASQVDEVVAAGARFVVSPGLSRAVVERCRELSLAVIPGVATASEIQAALELGLTWLKFFPAHIAGGPAAVKALTAPFSGLQVLPTGGVTLSNLEQYLALPNVAAVGGSWMVTRQAVAAGDWATIRQATAQAVAAASRVAAPPPAIRLTGDQPTATETR